MLIAKIQVIGRWIKDVETHLFFATKVVCSCPIAKKAKGEGMEYRLIRQKRKSVKLEVKENGEVVVKAPNNVPIKTVEQWLRDHEKWINDRLEGIKNRREATIFDQEVHYLGGKAIILKRSDQVNFIQKTDNGIAFPSTISHEECKIYLRQSQLDALAELLNALFFEYCKKMKLTVNKVRIKDMKSRWGSCSTTANISINARLALAPYDVIEYIVVHEIAHRRYMNHQKEFWCLVEKYVPDYKEKRMWLKTNIHHLYL